MIKVMPRLRDRLDKIQAHIEANAEHGITEKDQVFLAGMRRYRFGSDRQLARVSKIELQLFGKQD